MTSSIVVRVATVPGGAPVTVKCSRATPTAPLIPTPAFPGYASAHATLSGAACEVLERTFGVQGHAITLTTPSLPLIVLDYNDFETICDDIDDARIYGGIHFRCDQEAGTLQGRMVGNYILTHYLR